MTNYDPILGITNKWAPIVFAVLYFFIFIYYISQAIRRHASIYSGLAFFSLLRIVAFSLRAAMANNSKAASNEGIAIAYAVLYTVGFFSILLSAYRLLHDRERLARMNRIGGRITSALHRGHLVHLLLFLAVVLGTVGLVYALGTWGHTALGNSLNSASTYIFLAVAVIIAILTFLLIRLERKLRGTNGASAPAVGANHHHLILALIAALLLLRTLYYGVTVHKRLTGQTTGLTNKQSNEHFWYPLAALAELLAAMLFLVPGLVPLRSLLHRHRDENLNEKNAGGQPMYAQGEYAHGTEPKTGMRAV